MRSEFAANVALSEARPVRVAVARPRTRAHVRPAPTVRPSLWLALGLSLSLFLSV